MRLAKVAAERALLSTIPDHVMRELERHAAEAKLEAEKLKVGTEKPHSSENSMKVFTKKRFSMKAFLYHHLRS